MLLQIVKKDFQRNKIITIVLFIFMMLSALLAACASQVIMELYGSLSHLLDKSKAPHFVQMHAGPIDHAAIQKFAATNPLVKNQQTVEMLRIDGSKIVLGNSNKSEENSVMDIGFVKQNPSFDLLLNLENQVIKVSEGEIAVPIYYMKQNDLNIGDQVTLSNGQLDQKFIVTDFVRDIQMNPAIVSSKRFVVNDTDYNVLKKNHGEVEYLIEFQITDLSRLSEFRNAYQSSDMPGKGPMIDYPLFKTLNALTDGIIAVVIILVSILLMIIATLSLRFTMIATLEEDYRKIGVMKAIGISQRDIRRIYLAKYMVMAACASLLGYLLSLGVVRLFTANITLYLGTAPKTILQPIVPVLAVGLIFWMIVFFCSVILRRFNRITVVEALRSGTVGELKGNKRRIVLSKRRHINVNVFLGLKDVYGRFTMFGLLFFVFVICLFIILVPVNILNTLQSPRFISYMGVGQSDMRIDLQQSDQIDKRFNELITTLNKDSDIAKFSPLITSRFKVLSSDGVWENINVETGDFSIFPLTYVNGGTPESREEIALSDLNAKEWNKRVGDSVLLEVDGTSKKLKVSGIYQDITNGGRTAKARLPYDPKSVLWYIVALDVNPNVSVQEKMDQYAKLFYPAKVTPLESYLSQTLGNTIRQLKLVTGLSIAISISISVLITALFLKMLLAKDVSQIAILRSIGFTLEDIRKQYQVRLLLVSGFGIILGTFAANTIGQKFTQLLGSFMGASKIQFVVNPVVAYLVLPLFFMLIVALTTVVSTISMKKSNLSKLIVE
ncbi:putative ABC transport system permease protein [Paenibacillus sp. PastF-3]|uniref:ABC transporter permease n=1 Tax=Paenibacillus sp. PastF-3 TaxID=2940626 RepID=UPI002472EA4F|nr:ABC transporter permease [Paenibacillus sp. PastF-3]MDH6369432.1 putative ABC transport system permease protein [Paenibacillus sp. PastF-3]